MAWITERSPLELIAALGLVLGLLLAAICQVRCRYSVMLRRLDVLGCFVPWWNLFAPSPIIADYLVSYQFGQLVSPAPDERAWTYLPYPGRRQPLDFLFMPRRRARKAWFETAGVVVSQSAWMSQDELMRSVAYLAILNAISRRQPALEATGVRFRIEARWTAYVAPRVRLLYTSPYHRLGT
ncbi:MAG: hypothetical protein QM692_19390 [Thermomicrobiales bacterium]